jgi:hypothetical protein
MMNKPKMEEVSNKPADISIQRTDMAQFTAIARIEALVSMIKAIVSLAATFAAVGIVGWFLLGRV